MVVYKSLKTKEKSNWVIPKIGLGHLRELFITKFKSQFKDFKWGFAKVVVVTRAGRSLARLVARRASIVT